MKKFLLVTLTFLIAVASGTAHAEPEATARFRTDCRFYGHDGKFCYSSAIYDVHNNSIDDIKFGVGCNYETIFNDSATSAPQSTTSDLLRPKKAAFPRIEIIPQDSLKHPGTYSSLLEISSGIIKDGLCHVTLVDGNSPYDFNFFLQ